MEHRHIKRCTRGLNGKGLCSKEGKVIQSSIESTRKEVVAENGVVAGGHDLVAQTGVEIMQRGR